MLILRKELQKLSVGLISLYLSESWHFGMLDGTGPEFLLEANILSFQAIYS
jgi:hypothetical protein